MRDFILWAHTGIFNVAEEPGKLRCSHRRIVRSRISLHSRRERKKLKLRKPINELAVKQKTEKFRISLKNRCLALTLEVRSVEAMKDRFTGIITQCAAEVGGRIGRQDTAKLPLETKDLVRKRQSMTASNPREKIELAELYS